MRKPFAIAFVIAAVGLLSICGFASLVLFWAASSKTIPLTESDTQVVVTAADLEPYFQDYASTTQHETFEKIRYLDQSVELNYEYSSPDDNDPYISVSISYELTKGDAAGVYLGTWTFQQLGFRAQDQDYAFEELESFYNAGDRSRFANITYGGEPVGHLLLIQKANIVYSFLLSGFLIEDASVWRDLFHERIQNL
ncbi:MAG TPA: hypothetical protein DEF45_20105 [Rhodopirellula sp.]|nr:hypothetical protein [Rhodopirellula sp.]